MIVLRCVVNFDSSVLGSFPISFLCASVYLTNLYYLLYQLMLAVSCKYLNDACGLQQVITNLKRVVYLGRASTCKGWVFSSRYLWVALEEIIQLLYVYGFKSGIFQGLNKTQATPRLASLRGLIHIFRQAYRTFSHGLPGPGIVYDTPNYKK